MASSQLASWAILRAASAPLTNWEVTSSPVLEKTLLPFCSDGILGVDNPPSCSGQMGMALPCLIRVMTFWQGDDLAFHLQLMPARQAETIFMGFWECGGSVTEDEGGGKGVAFWRGKRQDVDAPHVFKQLAKIFTSRRNHFGATQCGSTFFLDASRERVGATPVLSLLSFETKNE